jgi:hypothetical protein
MDHEISFYDDFIQDVEDKLGNLEEWSEKLRKEMNDPSRFKEYDSLKQELKNHINTEIESLHQLLDMRKISI